jgi:hypothetical protein
VSEWGLKGCDTESAAAAAAAAGCCCWMLLDATPHMQPAHLAGVRAWFWPVQELARIAPGSHLTLVCVRAPAPIMHMPAVQHTITVRPTVLGWSAAAGLRLGAGGCAFSQLAALQEGGCGLGGADAITWLATMPERCRMSRQLSFMHSLHRSRMRGAPTSKHQCSRLPASSSPPRAPDNLEREHEPIIVHICLPQGIGWLSSASDAVPTLKAHTCLSSGEPSASWAVWDAHSPFAVLECTWIGGLVLCL